MSHTPTLLTPKEAAAFLKLSEKTLKRWRSTGTGPKYRRLGSRVRYLLSDLTDWTGTDTQKTTQEAQQ